MSDQPTNCASCAFWKHTQGEPSRQTVEVYEPGLCLRHAPMRYGLDFEWGVWPVTKATNWCGDYQPRDPSMPNARLQRTREAHMDNVGGINRSTRFMGSDAVWPNPYGTIDRLAAALLAVKRGDCWCDMGIGNPMVRDHSPGCLQAQAAVETTRAKNQVLR